jgi:hypothetical protein
MNIERFAAFSVWFKTNRYVLVAEPAFETESSQIKLICIHCQEDPFTVYPAKNGGWNIGHFTRHFNTDKVCPNLGVPEASRSMDTIDNVSTKPDLMTQFVSR